MHKNPAFRNICSTIYTRIPCLPGTLFEASEKKYVSDMSWCFWALLVFLIPYQLYYNFTLNMFYHYGAPFADTGLFAHLLWRNDWSLANPHYRGDFSFFGVHLSPILLVLTGLSHILPTHPPEFCAGWTSALFASFGVALLFAFRVMLTPRTQLHMALLALLATGFSFNAVITHGIWLPHFEYAIPLLIGVFILLYKLGRHIAAAMTLFCLLAVREDAGFHLACVLGLLVVLNYYEKRSFSRIRFEAALTIAAIGCSVFALWVVGRIVSTTGYASVVSFIYIGNPPFNHLSLSELLQRIHDNFYDHLAVWVGMSITAFWAWRTRSPVLLVGFAASIPWVLLSLCAANGSTARMYAYYAFPLTLGFGWPLLGMLWQYGWPVPSHALKRAFQLQCLLILVGIFNWSNGVKFAAYQDSRQGSYLIQKGTENRDIVRHFISRFNAGAGDLGRVISQYQLQSLVSEKYHGQYVRHHGGIPKGDTYIYINGDSSKNPDDRAKEIIEDNALKNKFCLPETGVCMYTNRTQKQVSEFSSLFVPYP